MIIELKYSNTNTYLIRGGKGALLFDTGWAGTFLAFCRALGEERVSISEIRYILISHYHPDHMGIAQEIAEAGAAIVVMDVQQPNIHGADAVFEKEGRTDYMPMDDTKIRVLTCGDSRKFLKDELGLDGEILHTPGHSGDSISLRLDSGELFVGDLNPLYELELHRGTEIGQSWDKLLACNPQKVYYGHAKTEVLKQASDFAQGAVGFEPTETAAQQNAGLDSKKGTAEQYALVKSITKYIDRGYPLGKIAKKTGANIVFVEDVARMYLTHQNVGVQGILDRIEIKGR